MTMQAESLDVLEKAAVPPAQARAIVRAIEIEIAGAKDTLATKHDMLLLRQDLYQEIGKVRQEMTELRGSLEGQMTELRASLEGRIAKLRVTVDTQIALLRSEMAAMRSELRAEIQTAIGSSTRQIYMALLGQTAVMLGFAYFFATHIA